MSLALEKIVFLPENMEEKQMDQLILLNGINITMILMEITNDNTRSNN